MATDYEALAREFGGSVEPVQAEGMGIDAQGRPVLRVNIGRQAAIDDVDYGALAAQFGGSIEPVQTVDVPPSDLEPQTTAGGAFGATTRGIAPAMGGALLGAALGAPVAGVGAVPGALAGAAAGTLAQFAGDPIVSGVNSLLGTNFSTPSEAMENLLTQIGVPEARSAAERVIQSTAGAIGGVAGGVGIGRVLAEGAGAVPTVTQGVGQALAAQPMAQAVGGAAAGAVGQQAQELGADPVGQIVLSVLAGVITPVAGEAALAGLGTSFRQLGRGYVEEQAARMLQQSTLNEPRDVARRIDMALIGPNPAGVAPTTAELAADPGLSGLTRSLQTGVQAGARISDRLAQNAQQRGRAVNAVLGPGDTTQLQAQSEAIDQTANRIMAARQQVVGDLQAPEVAGAQARNALVDAERAAKTRASALYDIPGGEEPVQIGAMQPSMPAPQLVNNDRALFQREGQAFARGSGVGRAPAADNGQSLIGWVKSRGGIVADSVGSDDLRGAGITSTSVPGIFNNTRGGFTKGAARSNLRPQGRTVDELTGDAIAEGLLPDGASTDDFVQLLTSDYNAMRGGPGNRVFVGGSVDKATARASFNDAERFWDNALSGRDPDKMTAEDWDGVYREAADLEPRPVTADDMRFLSEGADAASGVAVLSPFQSSLVEITRDFFPAGLPPQSGVATLVGQLLRADVLEARQVERIVRDLRKQSGRLRQSDSVSAGLAKAVANATEGFLAVQAGPARADALRQARAGWREYATTFRTGEPGRVLASDAFGNRLLDEARVSGTLVPAGATGATAAGRLQTAVGSETAENVARGQLRQELEAVGNDVRRLAAVADRYKETLRVYPSLRADVDAVQQIAALQKQFEISPLRRVAQAGDPVEAVSMVMRQKDGARDFRQLVGQVKPNKDATAGLRRAIAGYVENASQGGFNPDGVPLVRNAELEKALVNVLGKTEGTGLLSREQRNVLLNLRMQAKRVQAAATNNRTPGSDTMRNGETWGRLASVVLQGVGASKLGMMNTVLDATATVLGRASAVRELTVQAMLDPALAADLLRKPTPRRLDAVGARMRAYAIGVQPTIVSQIGEPTQ